MLLSCLVEFSLKFVDLILLFADLLACLGQLFRLLLKLCDKFGLDFCQLLGDLFELVGRLSQFLELSVRNGFRLRHGLGFDWGWSGFLLIRSGLGLLGRCWEHGGQLRVAILHIGKLLHHHQLLELFWGWLVHALFVVV